MSGRLYDLKNDLMYDLKNVKFWKAVVAEYLGTWFLVLIGCGTCLGDNWQDVESPKFLDIAFAFGLIVTTMVWSIGHTSGGHINPAVTCGMLVARKITIARAVLYIISQCLGAITGAGILEALSPTNETRHGSLGETKVSKDINAFQGFGVEFLITFVLVFTVFASCDKKRTDLGGSAPLTIGLSVAVCHLFAIKFTGSSMNPARSFGPAVINRYWTNQWVYWIGPIFGGVIAALVYEFCFAVDASIDKIKSYFTVEYNNYYDSNDEVTTNGGNQQPTKTGLHEAESAQLLIQIEKVEIQV